MTARRVKLPSFQFYPGDWLRDAGLRACTAASRGVWMDLLCFMHDSPVRGHLLKANGQPFTDAELSRAVGCSPAALRRHLAELEAAGVYDKNAQGVIVSRRMSADEEARRQASENGKRGGNPELLRGNPQGLPETTPAGQPDANRGVNPPLNRGVGDGISPSSSSSSPSVEEKTPSESCGPPPAGAGKAKPAKPRKQAEGPHHDAIRDFCGRWQAKYGEKYPFAGGKDADHFAEMLKKVDQDTAKLSAVFARFFADNDPFYAADARHSASKLRANFQRWLVDAPLPSASKPTARDQADELVKREFAAAFGHLGGDPP